MSNKEHYQPESMDDVEADDELFGEVIEQSDAQIDAVNVMNRSDLSESSSPHGSAIQLAKNRKSDHAGVGADDRPIATAPPRSGAASGVGLTIALAVLVIGGIYLLTLGGNEAPAGTDVVKTAPPDKPSEEPVAESDEGQGDGTPTLDAATLTKGMVAAGWRVGEPSIASIKGVTQTDLLAQTETTAVTITIYESKTWDWTKKLIVETEPPAKAVSFGRTVARVSLGPPDKQNGVVEMVDALNAFKKAARAKAAGELPPETPPAPPTE